VLEEVDLGGELGQRYWRYWFFMSGRPKATRCFR
jgi:hypothetical protein